MKRRQTEAVPGGCKKISREGAKTLKKTERDFFKIPLRTFAASRENLYRLAGNQGKYCPWGLQIRTCKVGAQPTLSVGLPENKPLLPFRSPVLMAHW
jgi:hypothetical protein